jgi:Fe-Mn family superoxide dismutase
MFAGNESNAPKAGSVWPGGKMLAMMTRREAIKTATIATAACAAALPALAADSPPAGPFSLPALPYAFDALEPYIDARTMEIHHDKHHQAYVTNLNKALAGQPDLAGKSVEDLLRGLDSLPEGIRTAVENNGGGHYNHSLFWLMLKKDGGEPKGDLAAAIDMHFKSFGAFKDEFTKAATSRFGSGWAWLALDANKRLSVESSPNQDSPVLKSRDKNVLLGIDVWEHAYYLKYQNRRPEYVAAFFDVINWDFVADRYQKLIA